MTPPGLQPILGFPPLLRQAGFAVAPDQTVGFVAAIGALGPRGIADIRSAALALFAIPPERIEEFDALFRAHFMGQTVAAAAEGAGEEDSAEAHEATGVETEEEAEEDSAGDRASLTERLGQARLRGLADPEVLAAVARDLPRRVPRRRSFRRVPAKRGDAFDLRRTLREAVRRDGEALRLFERRRKLRDRRIIMLIDVSGSMQGLSEQALRLAHVVVQVTGRAEVFTLGTRLTRVTPALGPADADRALARAAGLIADYEGGTRLGPALSAYLSVPRYAGMARGAAVVMLSDGLERGDVDELTGAVRHLTRLAWRTIWLSPLAADPEYRPETAAMARIVPMIDRLEPGADLPDMARAILSLARAA
jgi:uncharacterized protein with von Willebrand factor type A (vWA) domain